MSPIAVISDADSVPGRMAGRLAAFIRTLRNSDFAVGLGEGQDAAAILAAGYGDRPDVLRSAFKHLFSARKSDWDRFEGLFDAFWLGKRVRSRVASSTVGGSANNPSVKSLRDGSGAELARASPD